MSVTCTVYRHLLRAWTTASAEGIPFTGCVALPEFTQVLCPVAYISARFRQSHELDDGFVALRMLPRQFAVLRSCEEESRQALQQWSRLQQFWCTHSPLSVLQQLEAAESAAWLLQRLVTQQAAQQMLCEGDVQEVQRQTEEAIDKAHRQLDEFAEVARATQPNAFGHQHAPAEQRLQQLEALTQVLFKQARLRNTPFEWVYDGLAPALLPQVLERSKGMPLSLALVAAAVARRLGVRMQLLCAPEGLAASTAQGPLLLQQLPAEVAARQAGRTTASAPSPDNWLLQLLPPAGQSWGQDQEVFLDVSQNGKLLTAAACSSRYPQLQGLLQQQPPKPQQQQQQRPSRSSSSSQIGWLPPEPEKAAHSKAHSAAAAAGAAGAGAGAAAGASFPGPPVVAHPPSVVAVWASLARAMVTAHQRRGESDLVAHWLYQLLALDSQAPEWAHVLQ